MSPRKVHLLLLLVGSAPVIWAQAPRKLSPKDLPSSAFKLVAINVTGTRRYTPAEIIDASGLKVGERATDADFKVAAQHLGDTGAFSNVAYSFQYANTGTRLDLQLTDNDQLVPARFENFVWFSDQELMDKLHARVPLFQGSLPLSGNLADQVSEALQALLIEHDISGRADYLRAGNQDGGPIQAFQFSVTGISIRIRNCSFPGASANEQPLLEAAARQLQNSDYSRTVLQIQEDKNFLPVYLARGYLKAKFGAARAKVAETSPQSTLVDLDIPVDRGPQYRLDSIELSGNKVLTADQVHKALHLQVGQPVDAVQLGNDLGAIKKLFGTKGYMAASVEAEPAFDDAQSTVKYQLRIAENDVYKMGDLDIQGLDKKTTQKLFDSWKILGGATYDSSYPEKFLHDSADQVIEVARWKVGIYQSLNSHDKTVDVTLRFDPREP
ncbi:MAG TPA: POTRA domain-containing protein [Terriglobales bacterium]|nr:POTRA domain-containing protein [Terriglobales bacterium]